MHGQQLIGADAEAAVAEFFRDGFEIVDVIFQTIEKNEIVFFAAKDYYQLTNVGTSPLILFGNRSEPFGVRPVRAGEEKS